MIEFILDNWIWIIVTGTSGLCFLGLWLFYRHALLLYYQVEDRGQKASFCLVTNRANQKAVLDHYHDRRVTRLSKMEVLRQYVWDKVLKAEESFIQKNEPFTIIGIP